MRRPSTLAFTAGVQRLRKDLLANGATRLPTCSECGEETDAKAMHGNLCVFCWRESTRSNDERPYQEPSHG